MITVGGVVVTGSGADDTTLTGWLTASEVTMPNMAETLTPPARTRAAAARWDFLRRLVRLAAAVSMSTTGVAPDIGTPITGDGRGPPRSSASCST